MPCGPLDLTHVNASMIRGANSRPGHTAFGLSPNRVSVQETAGTRRWWGQQGQIAQNCPNWGVSSVVARSLQTQRSDTMERPWSSQIMASGVGPEGLRRNTLPSNEDQVRQAVEGMP